MLDNPPHNAAADRAVRFINRLQHTKGRWARQRFNLRPWQERIVRYLFGTLDEHGRRRYRTAFIFLPRKNGKSELCSAIAAYCLMGESEAGGQIYGAATDREQASLVFNVTAQMIRSDRELDQKCKITDTNRRIIYTPTNSVYRAIASDAPHAHGFDASVVIADEVHAWRTRDLWDVLTTSFGAREQPLTVAITTAGYDRTSLCHQLYDYSCKVRDGVIDDPSFLPILYEAPPDDDWQNEATWFAANPALGDFRSLDEMRAMAREAREVPARETVFRQLYLNQWVDSAIRWIGTDTWTACRREFTAEDLAGKDCYAGLDLAYRDDYAALVLLFPGDDGTYRLLPYFWIPSEGKRDRRQSPLREWMRAGYVITTPGTSTDFAMIRDTITELGQKFTIREIAVDPWNAQQLGQELSQEGMDVVQFPQSMRNFTEPTKEFEARIKAQTIHHPGHPVLTWMVSNVMIETDASGNYRPSKKKSTEKIDGAVAAIMALARAMLSTPSDEMLTWI